LRFGSPFNQSDKWSLTIWFRLLKDMKIPFARPMLSDIERSAINDVMNGTVLTHGPNCASFESNFANYVGSKHAVTTSN
jgi:perosamine synthetase